MVCLNNIAAELEAMNLDPSDIRLNDVQLYQELYEQEHGCEIGLLEAIKEMYGDK